VQDTGWVTSRLFVIMVFTEKKNRVLHCHSSLSLEEPSFLVIYCPKPVLYNIKVVRCSHLNLVPHLYVNVRGSVPEMGTDLSQGHIASQWEKQD
jgi:hypothetical protein